MVRKALLAVCTATLGVAAVAHADDHDKVQGFVGVGPVSIPGSLPWSLNAGVGVRVSRQTVLAIQYERDAAGVKTQSFAPGGYSESGGGSTQRVAVIAAYSPETAPGSWSPTLFVGYGRFSYRYMGVDPWTGYGRPAFTRGATGFLGGGAQRRVNRWLTFYGDVRLGLDLPLAKYTADPDIAASLHLGVRVAF